MSKNARRDMIAVVLIVFVVSMLFLATWIKKSMNDTPHTTRFSDASERFLSFVRNYDSLSPVDIMTADLDPQTFIEVAAIAPDQGTANELLYISELIEQYINGADVEVLKEAAAILNEVIPHMRQAFS